MPRHWFIKTKSGKKGPVTSKMLLRLASKGRIQPNSGVSCDGESWIKAKEIAGLSFSDPDSQRWFIKTKGGDAGPFTVAKLNRLANAGRIRPDFAVSSDGETWIQAQAIPGLKFAKPSEPAPQDDRVETECQTPLEAKQNSEASDGQHDVGEQPKVDAVVAEGAAGSTSDTQTEFAGQETIADGGASGGPARKIERLRGEDLFAEEESTDETFGDHSLLVAPSFPHTPADLKTQWSQAREAEYLRKFGPIGEVSRSTETGAGAIDVFVHPPSARRPITTLVTSGMSDVAMVIPHGSGSPRAELVMYVQQLHPDYIELLRTLAQLPHAQNTRLSYGSMMNNGNPPEPIFAGSVLDGYVFLIPNIEADFKIHESLRIDDDPLLLLWVVPVTTAERDFITRQGIQQFCQLLDQNNHSLALDPQRRCYASESHRLVTKP